MQSNIVLKKTVAVSCKLPRSIFNKQLQIVFKTLKNNRLFSTSQLQRKILYSNNISYSFSSNAQQRFSSNKSTNENNKGFLGFPEITSTVGWNTYAENTLKRMHAIKESIINGKLKNVEVINQKLLELHDIVTAATASAEICIQVHPEQEQKEAAQLMKTKIRQDNTYAEIFQYLKSNELSVKIPFLHLRVEPSKLDDIETSRKEIFKIEDEFMNNYHNEVPTQFKIRNLRTLPKEALDILPMEGSDFILTTNPMLQRLILNFAPDSEARQVMQYYANKVAPENQQTLIDLLEARFKLANLLGFDSYSKYILSTDRLASEPSKIRESICKSLKPLANIELEKLGEIKKQKEKASKILSWDRLYYQKLYQEQRLQKFDRSQLPKYFSLENCIEGLNKIAKSLFGVSIQQVELSDTEKWHPTVRKLIVTDEKEGVLAVIYLDILARADKNVTPFTSVIQPQKIDENSRVVQPATLCIGANFITSETEPSLTYTNLLIFYHEFGHVFGTIFQRHPKTHLSQIPMSFAEIPSRFMEQYAQDYRVVSTFAINKENSQPIPKDLFEAVQEATNVVEYADKLRTATLALFDLSLHSARMKGRDASLLLHQIQEMFDVIPPLEKTHFQTQFTHLIEYGSKYYSYILCDMYGSRIWNKYFAADPFNQKQGIKLRNEFLALGGVNDPYDVLRMYLDENPNKIEYV